MRNRMRRFISVGFTNFVGFFIPFRERNRENYGKRVQNSKCKMRNISPGKRRTDRSRGQKKPSGLRRRALGDLVVGAVEEGDHLGAVAFGGGAEGGGGQTGGDAVFHRLDPHHLRPQRHLQPRPGGHLPLPHLLLTAPPRPLPPFRQGAFFLQSSPFSAILVSDQQT